MLRVLADRDYEGGDEFVAALNKARLDNRKQWLVYFGKVNGKEVEIKTYDTGYLQICRVNGLEHAAPMDMKPTAWKEFIRKAVA